MTATAQTRIMINKNDMELNTLNQATEEHLQDDISTIRDVREIMGLEDETMSVDKPKVVLIFPEGKRYTIKWLQYIGNI